ncbi:MAG: Fe-S cluster assembly protein SufB [Thaumarchaeota archaeon]|nr:MAG: Fe-S cluster assembly protein SufB [Nitrososphaerota archaeon]TLY11628.1 MAG: Fe-S cluster assembly protein SufB [Nitrososphaerota archaeon]
MSTKVDIAPEDYKEKYGFSDSTESYAVRGIRGLNEEVIKEISRLHDEPIWMEQLRLRALKHFLGMKVPKWAPELGEIDYQSFYYYARPTAKTSDSWDQVPDYIKKTYDRLGVTEAEQKFLSGVGAIYESESVYHSIQKDLERQGVIFSDTVTALKQYPDIMKKYFGTVVPFQDNYIAALQTAVWSAGSFVWVPEGVKVGMPLQAYFRMNERNMGQFERTLIIAEPYSEVNYIEGCTAPVYSSQSLHSAIVEMIAKKGSLIKYTTLQNWSKDVFNLVTKRAHAYEDATVSWVDFNGGSRLTRKYPSVYLLGPRAKADIISVAYAGSDQVQDTGGKAVHLAPDTTSKIISRSVSKDGGHTAYRGLLHIAKGARNAKSTVRCDALLIDDRSTTATYPYMEIQEDDATVTHEASVGKVGEELLFYLMSRGLSEGDALSMVVNGFLEPFAKELPMTYAVELNRLMALEMTNAVG